MAGQLSERSTIQATGRPALQFSLTALFILTTVFALALSTFFAISQFLGISALELLQTSLTQMIYSVPRVIVWSVGLAMAVRRFRTHRKPAVLTAIAMTGFIAAMLLMQTIQVAIIARMNSGQIATTSITWVFATIGVVYTLVDILCWILILMAIFSGRPADRPAPKEQDEDSDPFAGNESAIASIVEEPKSPFD